MALSINSSKSLVEGVGAMCNGISPAPLPYKWIRDSDPCKDTATKFKVAQNDASLKDSIDKLMETNIFSAEDTITLNEEVTKVFLTVADQVTSQKTGKPRTNKKKWFDWDCRLSKRRVNQVEPKVVKKPFSQSLRDKHFLRKKEYRAVIRSKKGAYLHEINQRINSNEGVN